MKIDKVELLPYGLSISFKLLTKDYNEKIKKANLLELKKIIVAISGPIVNLVIVLISIIYKCDFDYKEIIKFTNLTILIFNLIPIFPLDGGRILKGIIHIFYGGKKAIDITNAISNVITVFITFVGSILVYYYKNIAIFIIIIVLLLLRLKENKKYKIIKNAYSLLKVV